MADKLTFKVTSAKKLGLKVNVSEMTILKDPYQGVYEVTPLAHEAQTLNTANKTMKKDVTVLEIPYYVVSNEQNGLTVNIGG